MLVDNIELGSEGESNHINLAFRDPGSALPYQVKNILGLDADEIQPTYVGHPSDDVPEGFYIPTVMKREVVILLGLNPWMTADATYSSLRDEVWKLLSMSPSGRVEIIFKNGAESIAKLVGSVTKVETNHFIETPELQLTIDCGVGAMLEAPEITRIIGGDIAPDPNTHEFTITDDKSTAVHGFGFVMYFTGTSSSFEIEGRTVSWRFEVTYPFKSGDFLYFETNYKNRQIYVLRGGATIQLADKVVAGSVWGQLRPGENVMWCPTPMLGWNFDYKPTYWGI